YVNQLKASDVDVAGEFIYTASLLIHIKSKMLLPRAGSGPEEAAEDPRRELVERLLEHERFKNAAQMLQQKQMLEAATWTNPGFREFKDDEAAEPEIAADTVDLVRVFRDILDRARRRPIFNVEEDAVTVGQMIQFLSRRLALEDKPVALRRLLSHTRSEWALVAMFLALLELVRLQAILLRQDRAFSEIRMATAKIIPVGNSAGIILPKEVLARMNVEKGDTLYIVEGPQGIRLIPYDPEFARQMEAARGVMRENRDVLQRLAE